jgi:hypothetical protein
MLAAFAQSSLAGADGAAAIDKSNEGIQVGVAQVSTTTKYVVPATGVNTRLPVGAELKAVATIFAPPKLGQASNT